MPTLTPKFKPALLVSVYATEGPKQLHASTSQLLDIFTQRRD